MNIPKHKRAELLDTAEEKIKRFHENKIDRFYPEEGEYRRELYPKHMEFFAAGLTYRERCAMCANRVGKCTSYDTLIDTDKGSVTVGKLYEAGRPFHVYARPGVLAKASAPFKKARKEPCLRIEMSDGKWFECAFGHRVLTSSGWFFAADYVQLSRLQGGYAPDPTLSSWGFGPSIRDVDASRSTQTPQDFPRRYAGGPHQCGEQLLVGSGTAQGAPPSRGDGLEHILAWLRGGGLGARGTNTPQQVCDPLSSQDEARPLLAQCAEWLDSVGGTIAQSLFGPPRVFGLSHVEGVGRFPQGAEARQCRTGEGGCFGSNYAQNSTPPHGFWLPPIFSRSQRGPGSGQKLKIELGHNPLKLSNAVKAVYFIGTHNVYDFTVEKYGTYVAGGTIHHNTEGMGGFETSLHLTGDYPDWWPGRRFTHPVSWWACGKTNETARDIVQTKLMGPMGRIGTGLIRAKYIINWTRKAGVHDLMDTIRVQHTSGGVSDLGIKSYQQGRDSYEGTEKDGIWDDEEPPEDIYGEQLIRTATTNGMLMLTFTPLEGMSHVVMSFMPQESRLDV